MNAPTPLTRLDPADAQLYAKVEYLHPSGSMKHRSIPPFLDSLMAGGELRPGQRIAVRSAGSAAVSVAWSAARLGCAAVAVVRPASRRTRCGCCGGWAPSATGCHPGRPRSS